MIEILRKHYKFFFLLLLLFFILLYITVYRYNMRIHNEKIVNKINYVILSEENNEISTIKELLNKKEFNEISGNDFKNKFPNLSDKGFKACHFYNISYKPEFNHPSNHFKLELTKSLQYKENDKKNRFFPFSHQPIDYIVFYEKDPNYLENQPLDNSGEIWVISKIKENWYWITQEL